MISRARLAQGLSCSRKAAGPMILYPDLSLGPLGSPASRPDSAPSPRISGGLLLPATLQPPVLIRPGSSSNTLYAESRGPQRNGPPGPLGVVLLTSAGSLETHLPLHAVHRMCP